MDVNKLMAELERRHPGESEYLQAVREVLTTVEETYNRHPEFEANKIAERIVEPDRSFTFKVVWVDDRGCVQVNTGYRFQFNNAIGPYKGGLRFHPSVNPSILKFLGFEQIFKNALTTLPMGGAKGGSDFNPKGKSDAEVMRFCQAFMVELWRHIGPETDVPAGDIGVGGREIGYLYGMYRKLARENTGVLTGKGMTYGGSLIRPEATGFGAVYFLRQMLETAGMEIEGKVIAISGFGNVAWGVATKATELGAKVVTISGPDGYIYDPAGLDKEKIAYMLRAGQGGQRRRRRHVGIGDEPELDEIQLDGRGGRRAAAPHHVVDPPRLPGIRHRGGLYQLHEGRQHRRLHEGRQVDGRAGRALIPAAAAKMPSAVRRLAVGRRHDV